jgi:hypothetical protein
MSGVFFHGGFLQRLAFSNGHTCLFFCDEKIRFSPQHLNQIFRVLVFGMTESTRASPMPNNFGVTKMKKYIMQIKNLRSV